MRVHIVSAHTRLLESINRGVQFLQAPPEPAETATGASCLPLIQRLAGIRRAQDAGVLVAFSAISRGEGVTFVTETLAWELAKQTGEQILLTDPAGLNSASSAHFGSGEYRQHPVRRLAGLSQGQRSLHDIGWQDLQGLRQRFGFVLVDCPAIRESSVFFAASKLCDGVVLVVAAGEALRREVQYAQNVLEASSTNIIGLVLNKRVDPVPQFISRFL